MITVSKGIPYTDRPRDNRKIPDHVAGAHRGEWWLGRRFRIVSTGATARVTDYTPTADGLDRIGLVIRTADGVTATYATRPELGHMLRSGRWIER